MEDLRRILIKCADADPKARRELLAPYENNSGIGSLFMLLFSKRDSRMSLRALCDLAVRKENRPVIGRYLAIHKDKLPQLYAGEDAKLRKNFGELLGRVDADAYADLLMQMLTDEQTDFVRSTLILSLGKAKEKPEVLSFLQAYQPVSSDPKHLAQEKDALAKALDSLAPDRGEEDYFVHGLPPKARLILTCPNGLVTIRELEELGLKAHALKGAPDRILALAPPTFGGIYRARTFAKAGVLVGEYTTLEEAFAALSSKEMAKILKTMYPRPVLPLRIEVSQREEGGMPRKERINKIKEALSRHAFVRNSPSGYVAEVHVHDCGRSVFVSVDPSPRLDGRFLYRTAAVSASAQPCVAAACVYAAKEYLKKDAHVLDCFCGSGTMLFERAKYPYKSLIGGDISPDAIKAAHLNEKKAKSGASFVMKNAVSPYRERFDEIICNMPFGLRVSSHSENRKLYQTFLSRLPQLLTEDGVALLFTHEKKLLTELLGKDLALLGRIKFSAGGLYPTLFIVKPVSGN